MIDMQKLMEFCDNDAEMAGKFLEMFRSEAMTALSEMAVLLRRQDWPALSIIAHKMKSQCRYVGAERLAEIAAGIEEACDKNNIGEVPAMVEKFKTEMGTLLTTF